MFYSKHPELSGLCLFDPKGGEWTNKRTSTCSTAARRSA
jgi:hypothetical protein